MNEKIEPPQAGDSFDKLIGLESAIEYARRWIKYFEGKSSIRPDGMILCGPPDSAAPAKPTQQQLNTTMEQGTVLKSFAKAIAWMKMIDEGKATSISQLAELVGTDRRYVLYTIRLATLSAFCIGGR